MKTRLRTLPIIVDCHVELTNDDIPSEDNRDTNSCHLEMGAVGFCWLFATAQQRYVRHAGVRPSVRRP